MKNKFLITALLFGLIVSFTVGYKIQSSKIVKLEKEIKVRHEKNVDMAMCYEGALGAFYVITDSYNEEQSDIFSMKDIDAESKDKIIYRLISDIVFCSDLYSVKQ